jgi:hypothetical protein
MFCSMERVKNREKINMKSSVAAWKKGGGGAFIAALVPFVHFKITSNSDFCVTYNSCCSEIAEFDSNWFRLCFRPSFRMRRGLHRRDFAEHFIDLQYVLRHFSH